MRTCLALCVLLAAGCTPSDDKNSDSEPDEVDGFDDTAADTDTGDGDKDGSSQFVADADDGQSVVGLDPARYLGVWYEIASSPSPQQSACAGTTADYSLRDDGDIRVLNRCYLGSLDGSLNEIEGKASILDETYARLLVDFDLGFEAPYYVVELDGQAGDEPYEFAVVSSAGFALWVLSRTPQMDPELYDLLVERAADRGYPADTLIMTEQPE